MENTQAIKILLVDDNESKRTALKTMLGDFGRNLVAVDSGKDALRALLKEDFAVILMDVHMPVMDGFETAALIRQREKSAYVPIIFITAADKSESHVAKGYSLGAVDYIYTPVLQEVLQAKVAVFVELKSQAELLRAAAERHAAMAQELAEANRGLEQANRKLKESQMHLIQTEKMLSLAQLVAGIAHEINNPLAFVATNLFTVTAALELLAPEVALHLPEKAVEKMQKARARLDDMALGVNRVRDLVLNLRTFSRLDEVEFKKIDIHESIESVLLFLQHRIRGHIELDKQYGNVESLACNAGQLNQVLMHLIANAADAIEGPGTIRIATGQLNGEIFISVRDTGKGIPENIRHRIFEPFFTTKPVGQGSGLGLAISYGIVKAHEGVIEIESEVGKGTQFTIKLRLNLKKKSLDVPTHAVFPPLEPPSPVAVE
ncbi:MAG TPA: ATP-binding protein [Bryobacteraceae bacterium]|nr:ATP-binding protein [Bryobacteraceae bacterium]